MQVRHHLSCHDAFRVAGSEKPALSDPLMILVAGPYRSGTNDDPALIEANVTAMTQAALDLFRLGHLPLAVAPVVAVEVSRGRGRS
jgi:hypothetical protein